MFHKPEGKVARRYLTKRGITKETAAYWDLGYSPMGYIPECYSEDNINGVTKFWKKMNGRLIIPIYNQNGKLLSLSGRAIDPRRKPKYDHYPFPARHILFGLWQNKDDIRECNNIIITEGQFDVISAWQYGVKNVTSSFGAHAGSDHLALASRYTNNVNVVYDADLAGLNGLEIIKDLDTWSDLSVNLCRGIFPKNEDLDSWIRTHTAEELYYLIHNHQIHSLKSKLDIIKNFKVKD